MRDLIIRELVRRSTPGSFFLEYYYGVRGESLRGYEAYTAHGEGLNDFFTFLLADMKIAAAFVYMMEGMTGSVINGNIENYKNMLMLNAELLLKSTIVPQRDMVTGEYKGFYLFHIRSDRLSYIGKAGIDDDDIFNYKSLKFRPEKLIDDVEGQLFLTDNVLDCLLINVKFPDRQCVVLNGEAGTVKMMDITNTWRFYVYIHNLGFLADVVYRLRKAGLKVDGGNVKSVLGGHLPRFRLWNDQAWPKEDKKILRKRGQALKAWHRKHTRGGMD